MDMSMATALEELAKLPPNYDLADWQRELVAADRVIGEDRFKEFVTMAWPTLEPATPFIDNWHIDCLCSHLQAITEGKLRKVIFNVPPGSMKSLLVSCLWPAWHWLHLPADRFLTASYSDQLSLRDALKSRRLIQSRWYQALWGEKFRMTGDQNAKGRYENDKTGYRIATHVGGATGERAKLRILDDPHNIEEAESDTIRESVIDWVKHTWSERESDATSSADVVIMQRLHERDVSGYLLNEIGGYEHVMIPMRFEPSRKFHTSIGFDPRTSEGELLCPARWNAEAVKDKEKRLGVYGAAGQLMQRPAPEAGGIFKRHWFKYWQRPGQTLPPVMVKLPSGEYAAIKPVDLHYSFDKTLQSWDMTFKATVGTDFVVGQQYGRKGADTFLLDQVRDRMDFPQTVSAVRTFNVTNLQYTGKKLVEDKANGPAIIATLQREIPGFVAHPGNDDKVARAHAHAYVIEGGNFFLPHPQLAPWVESFIEEAIVYPNGTYDDQVVAMTQSLDDLYKVDDPGVAITPEFSARFHVHQVAMDPVAGYASFRFWYQGLYPCCVIGQMWPNGKITLLDCLLGEQNSGIEELIDRKVIPVLAADYRGCVDWRDITNHGPLGTNKSVNPTEHQLDQLLHDKLQAAAEPGEPDFFTRLNAIKGLLAQTGRLMVNPSPTPGEPKPWIQEALSGGYAFRKDASGVISKTESRRFHPLSSVGDAIGHGLCRLFVKKPVLPVKFNKAEATKRAKQYAV
jgi:predicted phage terminase large subunit-like protein